MDQRSQQQHADLSSWPSGDVVLFCLSVWALPLEFLLHRNFGRRYIGWNVLPAAIWPALFAPMVDAAADQRWTSWAFWLIGLAAVAHKRDAIDLERKGPDRHSRYCGEPWLGRLLRVDETSWKCFWEPAVCVSAGFGLMLINYPLGFFVVGAGFALRLKNWLINYHYRESVADLHDAFFEQQDLAERFRGRG